jgi:nucleotide-binding universal stress UspA family protein
MAAIVCGIDHSPHGRAAATAGAALAARLQSPLVLVHVLPAGGPPIRPVLPHRVPRDLEALREAAHDAGERLLVDVAGGVGGYDTRTEVAHGLPAEGLLEAADRHEADLIVVGTRGESAARGVLLGSVATTVIAHATCPVVVIPPGMAADGARPAFAGDCVVCGVETERDAAPARLAAWLAGALGVGLVLLRTVGGGEEAQPAAARVVAAAAARPVVREVERPAGAIPRAVLEAVAEHAGEVETRVAGGPPDERLAAMAVAERAAAVVVGSRGRGPLRAGLLGSTSRGLARHASVAVVIHGPRAASPPTTSAA